MGNKEKQDLLGQIGEMTIKTICEANGHIVCLSEDKFDSEKDMTIDGKTTEVKTQVPWFVKRYLTFGANQEKKMRNVDLLFVVGYNHTPNKQFNWANKIWRVKSDFKIASKYKMNNGKEMFAISLDDPAVSEWCNTPDEAVIELAKHSTSKFI